MLGENDNPERCHKEPEVLGENDNPKRCHKEPEMLGENDNPKRCHREPEMLRGTDNPKRCHKEPEMLGKNDNPKRCHKELGVPSKTKRCREEPEMHQGSGSDQEQLEGLSEGHVWEEHQGEPERRKNYLDRTQRESSKKAGSNRGTTKKARHSEGLDAKGKGRNSATKGDIMEMLLEHKIPLKAILNLCPRFKEKVLRKWRAELNEELGEGKEEIPCSMASAEDATRTRDDNVAKIYVKIKMQEVQGVILDGGSGVNVISETLTMKLGLTWEPITFNIRMADNRIVIPKGIVRNVKIQAGNMEFLVNLVVMKMQVTIQESYQLLLG